MKWRMNFYRRTEAIKALSALETPSQANGLERSLIERQLVEKGGQVDQ
jgi:hypothetical protein